MKTETKNIVKTATGAEADGVVVDVNSLVSMNMWAAYPEFVAELERGFADFLAEQDGDPLTKEFLLPVFVEKLLKEEKVQVQVLPTAEQWIGITYQEDLLPAREKFLRMTEKGLYPARLWGEG